MKVIPPWRRWAIAGVSLCLCAWLFGDAISLALVTRGDGYLQKGQAARAQTYYARALFFDKRSALAADRFAFAALLDRTPASLDSALKITSQALATAPTDVSLLSDRALLLQIERRFKLARVDFAKAAVLGHDARLYHFAGWAAMRAGDRAGAQRYWRSALRVDAAFEPSRAALSRNGMPLR